MSLIFESNKKLAKVLEREKSILATLVTGERVATEEEETELKSIEGEKTRLNDLIVRLTKVEQEKTEVDNRKGPSAPVVTTSVQVTREDGEDEKGNYRPFRSFGEQMQAVAAAGRGPHMTDKRLLKLNERAQVRAAAGMSEGVGADGGHLIQDDFSAELIRNAVETGLIAPRCRRFPTSPGATGVEFPVVNETSRVDGSRWGGVQVYRVNEAGAATAKKPKFALQRLGYEKLIGLCVVTDELLNDAPFLDSWLRAAFSEEFSTKIDNEIIRGNGVGQMLGVLSAPCVVSVAKETSQAAATINGMNCVKMFARLFARSQSNAVWLANQDCFPQIATLTITKDKSDIPIYQPANIAAGQTLGTILGRPVIYVEQCSTVGTVGDLILGDFSRYMIIEKDPQQASSIHVYFDTEQTAFRFSVRNNGMPMLKQAVTPMNGSNTLTDFVTLDTRA